MGGYRIYCSQCNKERKKKMSWGRYLYYVTIDNKTRGYQYYDDSFLDGYSNGFPTKCAFGHPIDPSRVRTISSVADNSENTENSNTDLNKQ